MSKTMRELRESLDTDGDGHVSAQELREGMRRLRIEMIKRVVHKMSLGTVWIANLMSILLFALVAFAASVVLTPKELTLALSSRGAAVVWTWCAIEPLWVAFWVSLLALVKWLLALGFDTDGDGKISFKEVRQGTQKALTKALDKDGDGKVSAAEVASGAGRAISRSMKNLLGSSKVVPASTKEGT